MHALRAVLLSGLIGGSVPVLPAAVEAEARSDSTTVQRSPRWMEIDPLLDQSIAALVAGQNEVAQATRERALNLSGYQGPSPVSPDDVLQARAERAIKVNQLDAAITDYREALQGSYRSDLRLALGQLLIARDRLPEAVVPLSEIPRRVAEYGRAQLLLGKAHLSLYARNKSMDELAEATLALDPPTRSANSVLTADGKAALLELTALLKILSPDQQSALAESRKVHRLAHARQLIESSDNTEALPLLNELLAQDPWCAEAYELRARVSDYERARNRTDLQIAAELRAPAPTLPAQGDKLTLALAQANLHVHQRPFDVAPYLERRVAWQQRGVGKQENAAASLREAQFAHDLDPDDPVALCHLSEAFYFISRSTDRQSDGGGFKAVEEANKSAIYFADNAVSLAPKQIDLLVWRADLERRAGPGTDDQEAARALLFLNRAIQALPTNVNALYARALAAKKLENYSLAANDCRTLIRLEPTERFYSYELGWILMNAEDFSASAEAFLAASGGDNVPDDARSLGALALAFAGDPQSEKLAAAIPEHSIQSSGMSTASWNIGHNKNRTSPLIQRVTARLEKSQK